MLIYLIIQTIQFLVFLLLSLKIYENAKTIDEKFKIIRLQDPSHK